MTQLTTLKFAHYSFSELFTAEGLKRLDDDFLRKLNAENTILHAALMAYRAGTPFTPIDLSELLLAVAPYLEQFLIELFDIVNAAARASAQTLAENPVSAFKQYFVLRRAKKLAPEKLKDFSTLNAWLQDALTKATLKTDDLELSISLLASQYIHAADQYPSEIENLTQWCAHALYTPEAQKIVAGWVSFQLPERLDYAHLVKYTEITHGDITYFSADPKQFRQRDGFTLTDPRMSRREVQDEVNYCIYCHDHDGDFCSKGFPAKKGDPSQGLKKNPLDVTLTGCPLDEKISEMHSLKRDGLTLAAFAMIMVDNPMCPATGHRICNDCMKACIYQKQTPVNIPQIETRILTDVLALPWGVEIYDLLTRWNPLRPTQWALKPYNGLKILIAGMGPAGFTLAHHLLMEGFAVVGFDGLKIEPLTEELINTPIYSFDSLREALDERVMAGFGGVAEYGITVRWDKNFLKLIYLSLLRKPYFQVFGNMRFGGTIQVADAWDLGFDHFVIAVGAGLPKALNIPGSLAPGMRQANDFLMALQLGSAATKKSLTNLQVRLPAVVIGGGLTGVDTATEVQAYYITQVEKTLARYEALTARYGEDYITQDLAGAELETLEEFLAHGKAVRKERELAAKEQRAPDFIKLIRAWGGVTIVYRRKLEESPAYINNHEELSKAFEEGIFYVDCLEPARVELNQYGHVERLICHKRVEVSKNQWQATTEEVALPARAIMVATGTQPNIAYEFEHRGTFNRLGVQYQHYEERAGELTVAHGIQHCKDPHFGPFTSYQQKHHRVSLIGDTHPVFHGNVVKAIASGMRTYPKIMAILKDQMPVSPDFSEYLHFRNNIVSQFKATVAAITRRAPQVLELTIQAPQAARHYKPGHFYRLQNFAKYAQQLENTSLQMEPLALIATHVDPAQGTLRFIVLEKGVSSELCSLLQVGEPVALMGPTGTRAKIAHEHETVLIMGGELSIPWLLAYGTALRQAGNRVLYLANLTTATDVYAQSEMEQAADIIIWNFSDPTATLTHRADDRIMHKDPVSALIHYAQTMRDSDISLSDIDRIYVIDSSANLRKLQEARQEQLRDYLIKNPRVFGSVYSTMQCMLKGVCAQCLQWQVDPETGQRTKAVFACSWPEQPLEIIDFANITERQMQNRLAEHLTQLWVEHLLTEHPQVRA